MPVDQPVHRLSRRDARRIAVRAQQLARPRPGDLLETVRRLPVVQLDPTNAVAPSADLVLWSRLGASYDPQQLRDACDELSLVELDGMVRPAEDVRLHRGEMQRRRDGVDLEEWQEQRRGWVLDNNGCRRDILERLRADGPLPQKELPDTCVRPWRSSGWNDHRNVTMMLESLVQRGEVAVAGRRGRDKLFDLAERVYPDEEAVPVEEAARLLNERRLAALGIARAKGPSMPGEPSDVGAAGEPAVIEGVKGEWRVDPEQLGQPFAGRAALLSPLDRLLHDRRRMAEVFEFEYVLEMYKPAAQRRWGYYALPILYADRLVGKLDARAERDRGVLRVDAVHQDVPFTATVAAAVDREIDDLARWLGLELERA
ncbi:YcaQ family DNA glycosylase [Nocardioides sp. KIGAM211]|uniref:YcaQ family DNA glycosylase n=1 Tax=Nocardioides luti TaxID=2761101 RepID=A0A7X0RIV9_9ACTN|nr:crosslink repair DNA glycosylase YcaQ family protein [Nocardioides luti]MBB6629131.1 YcaQ family DNA glycosylase [Nocardioides luti]